MANGFQVLRFIMVDFSESWDRNVLRDAVVEYRATGPADVKVVRESITGVLTTYMYRIEPPEVVYVIDQVIHLPAHCRGKEQGDTIQCNQG